MKISRKTKVAILKYGIEKCREAYNKHQKGYGAKTIAWEMGFTTRQADSMIDAFEEINQSTTELQNRIEGWCGDV
jgi:hypothetical protein